VYVSNPTWGNHNAIVKDSGLNVLTYPYYKPSTRGLDFEGMKNCLSNANPGSIILLHACAHNPTGVDLSMDQWAQLAEVFLSRGLLPLFDSAYQGYATGDLEKDVQSVRLFVNKGI
jgi:aspartate aminotransferase